MSTLVLHPARTAPRAAAAPLRLTRRGRAVVRLVAVVLALVAVAAAVLVVARVARADAQVRPLSVEYVVVAPGDTLWGIAGDVAPGADRRDTVARIVELNALPDGPLRAGQRIAVPASS